MGPRRLRAVVRGPRLVAAGLVLACAYLFATNLTPRPRYVVRTEAKYDRDAEGRISLNGPAFWGTVQAVADDGGRVTVGIHRGDWRVADSRLEVWDTRTGTNRTPAHWADPDWRRLLRDRAFWASADTGWMHLFSDPSGREFLHDGTAWAALRDRLAVEPARRADDTRQPVRPAPYGEHTGDPFPHSLRFSPDGRLVAYVVRNSRPVQLGSESTADGTVVERVRDGGRVALLPGVANDVRLAPGGRTAVSGKRPKQREDGRLGRVIYILGFDPDRGWAPEQSELVLWDLDTATPRAELFLPGPCWRFEYSPDGRYVFASCMFHHLLRWWDAGTGRPVGEIAGCQSYLLADRGRVLVIQTTTTGALRLWDVASGQELNEWEPAIPPGWTGRIGRVVSPGNDRYLVADFYSGPDPAAGKSFPLMDRLVERVSEKVGPPERVPMVVVLDVAGRRVLGPVPGRDAAVSPNGRWLATLDPDGVVRVWPLPLGRPWLRGLVYGAAVVLGGWAVAKGVGKLRRWIWRPSPG